MKIYNVKLPSIHDSFSLYGKLVRDNLHNRAKLTIIKIIVRKNELK